MHVSLHFAEIHLFQNNWSRTHACLLKVQFLSQNYLTLWTDWFRLTLVRTNLDIRPHLSLHPHLSPAEPEVCPTTSIRQRTAHSASDARHVTPIVPSSVGKGFTEARVCGGAIGGHHTPSGPRDRWGWGRRNEHGDGPHRGALWERRVKLRLCSAVDKKRLSPLHTMPSAFVLDLVLNLVLWTCGFFFLFFLSFFLCVFLGV